MAAGFCALTATGSAMATVQHVRRSRTGNRTRCLDLIGSRQDCARALGGQLFATHRRTADDQGWRARTSSHRVLRIVKSAVFRCHGGASYEFFDVEFVHSDSTRIQHEFNMNDRHFTYLLDGLPKKRAEPATPAKETLDSSPIAPLLNR